MRTQRAEILEKLDAIFSNGFGVSSYMSGSYSYELFRPKEFTNLYLIVQCPADGLSSSSL